MRVLVLLPTYNEIENIEDVLERARAALPDADVLVIDDGSPDGTADRAEKLDEELGGIEVLRRADEVGPRLRVPRRVPGRPRPRLRRHDRDGRRPLARPRGAARAGRRGRAGRRPRDRVALRARRLDPRLEVAAAAPSRVAAASTPRTMLGLSVHDATAGFRAYHRDNLSRIDLDHVRADGYGFQVEMTYLTERNGGRIVEVPISFRDRTPRPLEDVEPHRGRGVRCSSPGGASATGSLRLDATRPAARDTEGMALVRVHRRRCARGVAPRLLLVRNQRRNGATDWSTPGGVIDATDASLLAGLAREVEEETGLGVTEWEGPLYEVRAVAVELGWVMRCEVHRALAFEGDLHVDDPDGIVVDAAFAAADACAELPRACAPWVREPLADWLEQRWGPHDAPRRTPTTCSASTATTLRVVRT